MTAHARILLANGQHITAELPPQNGKRRWIAVFPFQIHPDTGMPTLNHPGAQLRFRVRFFGLPDNFDYHKYDVHEEDLVNYENRIALNIKEVEDLVGKWIDGDVDFKEGRAASSPLS